MPIRMEKDDPQPSRGNGGGQGGNNNFLIRLLPLLITFLVRRPKLIIPALLIGAVWYFFFGGSAMLSSGYADADPGQNASFSIGATLDPDEYDKAQVFEPVSYGYGTQSGLPARASLENFAPPRRHQGKQGSCVGWASAYAARSILEAQSTRQPAAQVAFSPAYLYNQIALSGCQGAYMNAAMKSMMEYGGLPFGEFSYDERTCSREPSSQQKQAGQRYRIRGYDRLSVGASNYKTDLNGIKQHIAQGYPVVIGMMVGGSFMQNMMGRDLWEPTQRDYGMRGYGGHAMCVIGYDDNYQGGAFQIMNSWGTNWGNDGIAWVRYKDFDFFNKEAYAIYPQPTAEQRKKMAVEFGLFDTGSEKTLKLTRKDDMTYRSTPIQKGDKFKVLIANTVECYTYVFGQETDGSSYVLFPYTPKHSAYCGVTGTRLFPRDYSMVADEVGNQDNIAIVVSKKELNFESLNQRINQSSGATFAAKLRDALGNDRSRQVEFKNSTNVAFEANTEQASAVAMVVEIPKQ